METWMVVAMLVVAFVVTSGLIWAVIFNHRRNRADAEASSRRGRVETQPLTAGEHDRFAERWQSTQASFTDSPAGAVAAAETLVEELMRARGYPVGDFDRWAADISVDHPRFVTNYMAARALSLARQRGAANTEDLKRATVNYRALFEELLNREVS